MNYNELVAKIAELAEQKEFTFVQKVKELETVILGFSKDKLLEHLFQADVIPERFPHDSTEEKLYAKYCDMLFARGLAELGLTTKVIEERADTADVEAKGENYSLVGDAKAFRLSRTAKNQKDFKVEALNSWKNGADYAVLLGPLYQYPSSNSQIYGQATRYNVTLFSFTHLIFLIKNKPKQGFNLIKLWNVAKSIPSGQSASAYWDAVLNCVLELTGKTPDDWKAAIQESKQYLNKQSQKEVAFWESEAERIKQFPHDKAVNELIKALKIKNKIGIIRRFFQDL